MKIQRLKYFKSLAKTQIYNLYLEAKNNNIPWEEKQQIKLLIGDYTIAIHEIENLITNIELVQADCIQALKGEQKEYYVYVDGDTVYDPYEAIYRNMEGLKLGNYSKSLYSLFRKAEEGFVNKNSSVRTVKEQVSIQDDFIFNDVESEVFFTTFDYDMNRASALAESYGSIESILSLVS